MKFEKKMTVPPEGWSTARLFWELQELSSDAVAVAHATGEELKPRGLMWVVIRYDIRVARRPVPGEQIRMETWAGPMRHRMSQRNYVLRDADGNCLVQGAGIWSIADRAVRCMVDAEKLGVVFPAEPESENLERPAVPQKLPLTEYAVYEVGEADLDLNGHMNNTRYFDLAEQCIREEIAGLELIRARAVFQNEALRGEKLEVRWGRDGGVRYFQADGNGRECFRMSLEYR